MKLFKNNFVILIILFLIGFIVHVKSFQMVPYGDDWKFIYNYYTHEEKELNFSNFPGIFAYLAPYGPAILAIGVIHQIFDKTYFVYYLFPLVFKVLTSFILFLTLQNIAHILKKNTASINFLSALLFLVGFTAIQAIDWSMNMNIYIAICIFILGLFFQTKYYMDEKVMNLVLSFFLLTFSIVVAPTRLTPLVVILPLIDLIMMFKKSFNFIKIFILKNILFAVVIYIFLQIGIFGNPGQINNSSLILPFIQSFLFDPNLAFGIFMHWIGITILPIYPSSSIYKTALPGALFVIILILTFYKSSNRWLIIGSIIYFITLFLMWLSSLLLKIEDADSRHLFVPFLGLTFLIGIMGMSINKAKTFFKFLLIALIISHIHSVDRIYSHWLSVGRGSDFISPVERTIMSHFPVPISEPKIIFLDFDDGAFQQSIEFGIGYRVAVLSETRNINLLPTPFSNRSILVEKIKDQIEMGGQKDQIIESIYAFRLGKGEFSDITDSFQEELRKDI